MQAAPVEGEKFQLLEQNYGLLGGYVEAPAAAEVAAGQLLVHSHHVGARAVVLRSVFGARSARQLLAFFPP